MTSARTKLVAHIAAIIASLCLAAGVAADTGGSLTVRAANPAVAYSGRFVANGTDSVTFGGSGARARLKFAGSKTIGVLLDDDSGNNYAMAWIDGQPGKKFRLDAKDGYYRLAEDLGGGEHTVEVVRVTECFLGLTHFRGFTLDPGSRTIPWSDGHDRKIEFIGDSITCGYGVEVDDPKLHFTPATENFCLGYSGLTARALDADYVVVARSGIGMVRNYDGPRDGNADAMPAVYPGTFYLQAEPKWDFSRSTPDVVCVNLGTNDFSTTGVDVEKFTAAYAEFVKSVLVHYLSAQVVALAGPMNNSDALKSALHDAIGRLNAEELKRVQFLELSAQGRSGYGADSHPNRAQSQINAEELTAFLRDLMDWR